MIIVWRSLDSCSVTWEVHFWLSLWYFLTFIWHVPIFLFVLHTTNDYINIWTTRVSEYILVIFIFLGKYLTLTRDNQKWTFQRNLQHRVPQDKNTTQYVLESMVYYDKSKLQFIETVISALYQIFYSVSLWTCKSQKTTMESLSRNNRCYNSVIGGPR
jgi:hypothetical protein